MKRTFKMQAIVAASCLLSASASADTRVRVLGATEMESTRGGVQINSVTSADGTSSEYDNIRINVDYENPLSSSAQLLVKEKNSSKSNTATVGSGASGVWGSRVQWRTSGWGQAVTRWNSGGSGWVDSVSSGNIRIDPNVRMFDIFVHATTIDGYTTTPDLANIMQDLDEPGTSRSWTSADSLDAIYGQCAGANQYQFRLAGFDTVTLSANCNDPIDSIAAQRGTPPHWGIPANCVESAFDAVTNNGGNLSQIHVFVVQNLSNSIIGMHLRGDDYATDNEYMIIVEESWTGSTRFDDLLAHELGHWTLRSSTSHSTSATDCSVDMFGIPTANSNNHVMCGNMAFRGRKIPSGQCTAAYAACTAGTTSACMPPYYQDKN